MFCLDLSSGNVCLKVYSGDLVVCETTISYYTDMEEIGNLLSSAANPVEFMCQVRLPGRDLSSGHMTSLYNLDWEELAGFEI